MKKKNCASSWLVTRNDYEASVERCWSENSKVL